MKTKSFFFRNLPIINFCISSAALTFQVTVLYPWHNEINKKMDSLSDQTLVCLTLVNK